MTELDQMNRNKERILIAAPFGRDAALITEVLEKAGHSTFTCQSIEQICQEVAEGSGAVLMTEEAFSEVSNLQHLLAIFRAQPSWSDLPLLVCYSSSEQSRSKFLNTLKELDRELNLIRMERPLNPQLLVSTVRAALRGRRRQYLQRDVLEELERAKEFAETASRSKSAFLTNMSHELRTPLNAIMGFAELIDERNLAEDDRRQFATTIRRNGRLLTQLIDDILDLSKVEAGKLTVEKIKCRLPRLLDDVIVLLGQQAREKGITLDLHSEGNIPEFITSDPVRLKQILFNIVGNAIKFTSHGGVEVIVKAEVDSESDQVKKLVFSVIDTGRGILPAQAEKLFQPFMQADASTTRAFGGTGLGLVLSRRLSEALGGSLELTGSKFGVGSTFTATVDVSPTLGWTTIGTAPKRVALGLQSLRSHKAFSGLKILVAEDSADSRQLINLILKGGGAEVDLANDGTEAVDKALKYQPDLILMDIQMPKQDGLNATSELRQRGFKRPIIALTAHAMKEEREKCLRAGCNDHLTKPINIKDLVKTISSFAVGSAVEQI